MRTKNCVGLAALIFAWAVLLVHLGNAASGAGSAASVNVTIDNFTFTPQTITVKVGTKITWTNHDDIPHSVMSENADFHSKALDTDDSFSFTPTKSGTYSYFCSLHPKMTAKVVVE
jgi:plastocyanin